VQCFAAKGIIHESFDCRTHPASDLWINTGFEINLVGRTSQPSFPPSFRLVGACVGLEDMSPCGWRIVFPARQAHPEASFRRAPTRQARMIAKGSMYELRIFGSDLRSSWPGVAILPVASMVIPPMSGVEVPSQATETSVVSLVQPCWFQTRW
jgi:hypothetical protein